MPPVITCCIVNCDADAKNTRKHRFPKDPVVRKCTNLENMDVEKVRNNYRICDYHFASEYMVGVQHFSISGLVTGAIPTLNSSSYLELDNTALIVQDETVNLTMESISSPRPQFFEVVPGPSHEHKHPDLLDRLAPNVGTRQDNTALIVQDETVNLTMESISSPRPQFFEVVPGPSHEHKHPDLLDRLAPNVGTRQGKPAELLDELNPDWAPSVNMGYQAVAESLSSTKVERYKRGIKSKQTEGVEPVAGQQEELPLVEETEEIPGKYVQTDFTSDQLTQMYLALTVTKTLEAKLVIISLTYESFLRDNVKTKYYTGLDSFPVLEIFIKYIEPFILIHKAAYTSEHSVCRIGGDSGVFKARQSKRPPRAPIASPPSISYAKKYVAAHGSIGDLVDAIPFARVASPPSISYAKKYVAAHGSIGDLVDAIPFARVASPPSISYAKKYVAAHGSIGDLVDAIPFARVASPPSISYAKKYVAAHGSIGDLVDAIPFARVASPPSISYAKKYVAAHGSIGDLVDAIPFARVASPPSISYAKKYVAAHGSIGDLVDAIPFARVASPPSISYAKKYVAAHGSIGDLVDAIPFARVASPPSISYAKKYVAAHGSIGDLVDAIPFARVASPPSISYAKKYVAAHGSIGDLVDAIPFARVASPPSISYAKKYVAAHGSIGDLVDAIPFARVASPPSISYAKKYVAAHGSIGDLVDAIPFARVASPPSISYAKKYVAAHGSIGDLVDAIPFARVASPPSISYAKKYVAAHGSISARLETDDCESPRLQSYAIGEEAHYSSASREIWSGTTKKKPYYLMDAMQFAVPFIKVAGTPTGNLPETSQISDVLDVENREEGEEYLTEEITDDIRIVSPPTPSPSLSVTSTQSSEFRQEDRVGTPTSQMATETRVNECKEKWRNLRSTFVKNLKPKPSGSGTTKKKPYYLMDAMQFAVPFIKVAGTPTGNLPETSQISDVLDVENREEGEEYLAEEITDDIRIVSPPTPSPSLSVTSTQSSEFRQEDRVGTQVFKKTLHKHILVVFIMKCEAYF
ncbi:hypothetical protein FQR65_LT15895 [Abscondita terminalis]|nr:hypothetical protein FQR65_LT15895 [Abscondita terminalis]